jgi:hypothetical protein
MSWSGDGGAAGSLAPGKRGGGSSGMLPQPNMTSTGTGPLASAGRTTAILISTEISGQAELSAWPIT